ncbi:MAG: hypothetical protein KBF52_06170, partial [Pyrinomonadaceae bacterium]|nr:hypothetical protein [Pyrinomonadaceae bacterium]
MFNRKVSIRIALSFVIFTFLATALIAQDLAEPATAELKSTKGKSAENVIESMFPYASDGIRNSAVIWNTDIADAGTYLFATTTSGSLTDMSAGTTQLVAANADDTASAVTNIGFDFYFQGVRYSQFSVNSNGSVRLGSVATSGTAYNPLGLASSSIITAYGADQRTHTTGKVHFKVTGTAGSRVVVIEFLNMQANFSTGGTADLTYQVRLSETTGVIEFVYGPMAMSTAGAADANSNSPQFGFSSSNTTGNVGSITAAQSGAPAPTFDGATAIPVDNLYVAGAITVLDSAADGSRRTFAFTPPVPAGPTGLSFTAITPIAQTLNWTDNAVNEDLFAIYRSTDGINYSYVGSAAEDATTFNDTGLAPSTNYFYQVYAVSEGALSTVLFGSQATSAPGNDTCNGAGGVWSSAGTWTDGSVPTATDNVTIGTGCTVEVDITTAVAYNVTVNSGGTLQSPATGATTTNNLTVSNNVTNNGTLDFSTNGDTSGAILTFGAGVNDVVFNGTGATTDVRAIAIAKGARATVVELSPTNFTVQGANTDTAGFLTITSGTFKISGSFAATNRVFTAPAYSIPTLGGFWINNPNFTVAGQNGSPTTTGLLRISNGTLNVGTGAGNSMAFATGSTIIVEGGAVNVAGRFAVSAAGNAITYTQTGGIITVCTVGNTSGTLGSFDLGTGLASTITMSGGTIVTQLQATTIDYRNQAGTGIVGVTGGTLQLGNANSGAAKSFNIRGVVPNLVVDNTSAGHTGTYSTTLANYNNISRNITINTGSTLNLGNVVFLFNGTTLTNNGTLTHNGASSNTVLFTDNAPVTYTGSGSVTAPLSALGIQSTLGFTIDPASSNIPANAVRLFAGNVINSSKLTVGNGGTTTSTVQIGNTTTPTAAGTFDSQMTFNPGSGGITVSYLRTTASRVTGGEIPATRSITNLTFDDNDITHNLAVAGGDLTVTGTMTLTNGVIVTGANTLIHNGTASRTTGYVGGQLARDYTAASAYTYFVGDNGFSPVSVSATAVGSPTSLKVQAVDSTLAGFLPGQSLSRYWNLTETGDITANLSFTYDIDAADVNGSEADYRVFKREAGVNTNLCISGPCVNSATNTLGPVVGVTDFSSWTGAENGASDTIAPDTTITSNPTDPSPSADATFDFTGTDSAIASVASFECQIDGGGYTACTSPKTYTGLSDGSHTFNVRAIDTAGNVDASPASYTWTISTAPLGPVSVTATAGTPGPTDYATLKAAFDAVNAGTHQGVITVSILGDTTETASAVLNESGSGSASYSAISIKPTGGAARTISGDIAGHLVDLNGADNVTIDGLNTGGNSLTISNVSQQTTASTIRFNNDATGNTVTNSTVSGSTGAALSSGFGVIYFGAATVTGNDNNTISNNNITAAGSNLPINGIFSQNLTAATDNSSITISGNNISNFFNTNSASSAVNVNSGNSGWTVSNNKIFQTGTRTYLTAATHNGVFVTSGSGYTVTGNTIGYAAANGTGIYTMTGTVLTRFVAINLAVGTAATTSVQGNTVASISIAGIGINSGNGSLAGVNIASGNVNVGDITPNTFGATSGTGSLTATPTTTVAAAIVGVNSASTGDVVISNNTFGSFTSAGPAATNPGAAFGINVSGAAASISITGNTFGNATAENIRAGVLGTTTGSSIAGGIIQTAVPSVFNYSNNTIQNISAYGTGTGGYVRGIQTGTTSSATATGTINNNTITNLTTSGALSGQSNGNSSAQGIQFMAGVNSTVSGNSISNISNVNAGVVGTVVAGIVHASGTNTVISNNRIWGLSNASTATSLTLPNVISGIVIRSGTTAVTVQNNMISVGNGQATNSYVFGIWGNHGSTPDPLDKVYFNTVNIEGTVASGAAPSAGFHRGDLTATNKNPAVDVRNNIFVNSRSGGTGKHYAIANHIGGASSNATGWSTVNNNVLNANASTIGYWTTDQTFAGWKLASSGDSLSYSNIPVTFVNNVSDLHLNMGVTPTSIESGGVAIAGITTDIDGQTRPGPTGSVNGGAIAPDIGADEFDGVYLDGSAPIITYSALSSVTSTTNRTLSVNITDGTGVAGGGNAPRVYFKKLADATYASTACSFASGTPQNGTYNCVIDYSLVGGGAVVTGDTVQYFVVAQDLVGNLSSNPSVGFTGTDVNTVTTPPTTPNAYMISAPFTGMYTVGSGGTYPSLTNAGGIFEAINSGVVTGNITIEIVSDMAGETGAVSLNQTTEEGAGNYTITIKPTGAPRVITGSSTTWIIRFADADRVTIDGSLSGGTANAVGGDAALRNLTIQNTSTTATGGAVIVMSSVSNGAQNNTIKNVNISGQDATQTLIGVHIGGATVGSAGGPNNNARIENCSFQKSIIGIYDAGASAAAQNSGNVVTMNDLSATGANKLRRAGMLFFNQDSLQVSMNSVGGIANDESGDSYGIGVGIQAYDATTVLSGAITNSLISRNKVNGVASTNTVGYSIAGIGISGGTTGANIVANNMVSGVMAPSTSPDIT